MSLSLSARLIRPARSLLSLMRRPEMILFLPAITLAAFWFGGERVLVMVALGAPLVFALAGAFQQADVASPALPEVLGGLGLRSHMVTVLDKAMKEEVITGKTTACLVVQFDDMDQILDRHGRTAQTEVLTRSAERICAALRSGDLVARLEGGGFAIALSPIRRLDLESVVQLTARLQSAVNVPISLNAQRLYVSASIG